MNDLHLFALIKNGLENDKLLEIKPTLGGMEAKL